MLVWILPELKQYHLLQNQKYSYIYEYENVNDLNDSYYLLNGEIIYKAKRTAKAEMLMQKNVVYSENSPYCSLPLLDSGEVAVSDNLMMSEGLRIGDTISVYNPLKEETETYVISNVVEWNYGLLSEIIDSNYGVIIFGPDNDVTENSNQSSVLFADNRFSASEYQLLFSNLYTRDDQLSFCRNRIIECLISIVVVQVTIQLLVYAVICHLTSQRMRKMKRLGTPKHLFRRFINHNLLYVSGGAIIGSFVIECLIVLVLIMNFNIIILLLVFRTILLILLCLVTNTIGIRRL